MYYNQPKLRLTENRGTPLLLTALPERATIEAAMPTPASSLLVEAVSPDSALPFAQIPPSSRGWLAACSNAAGMASDCQPPAIGTLTITMCS